MIGIEIRTGIELLVGFVGGEVGVGGVRREPEAFDGCERLWGKRERRLPSLKRRGLSGLLAETAIFERGGGKIARHCFFFILSKGLMEVFWDCRRLV